MWHLPCDHLNPSAGFRLPYSHYGYVTDESDKLLPAFMLNRFFDVQKLNWKCEEQICGDLESVSFQFDKLRMGHFKGLLIGGPFQSFALESCEFASPDAELAGRADVAIRWESNLKCFHTIGQAVIETVEKTLCRSVGELGFFICGTGGFAQCIAASLAFAGAAEVIMSGETENLSIAAVERIDRISPDPVAKKIVSESYEMAFLSAPFCNVLVDATEVGEKLDFSLLETAGFDVANLLVVDARGAVDGQSLIDMARYNGCEVIKHSQLVVEQTALAAELWALDVGRTLEIPRSLLAQAVERFERE